jgi:hypothetical protein
MRYALIFLCLGACAYREAPQAPRGQPRYLPEEVERDHLCNRSCDHFWYGGEWFRIRGHRHEPGCGHKYTGVVWLYGEW